MTKYDYEVYGRIYGKGVKIHVKASDEEEAKQEARQIVADNLVVDRIHTDKEFNEIIGMIDRMTQFLEDCAKWKEFSEKDSEYFAQIKADMSNKDKTELLHKLKRYLLSIEVLLNQN